MLTRKYIFLSILVGGGAFTVGMVYAAYLSNRVVPPPEVH